MTFQPKIQLIFDDVMQFLGVKAENDVIWRHVTSSCRILTKLTEIISLNDILLVSKYEVICVI